ncbi:YvrJ family protein [Archaeoglobales archaeon]|nr:MAG: YvrJ family protein [Archaeoglobales archaeon]
MEHELIQMVGNVGFPIAVAVYLLLRVEKRLEELKNAVLDLKVAIEKLSLLIDENEKSKRHQAF